MGDCWDSMGRDVGLVGVRRGGQYRVWRGGWWQMVELGRYSRYSREVFRVRRVVLARI